MNRAENLLVLEDKLENLRESLNNDVIKYIRSRNKKDHKELINLSRELDEAIVNYIKAYK